MSLYLTHCRVFYNLFNTVIYLADVFYSLSPKFPSATSIIRNFNYLMRALAQGRQASTDSPPGPVDASIRRQMSPVL